MTFSKIPIRNREIDRPLLEELFVKPTVFGAIIHQTTIVLLSVLLTSVLGCSLIVQAAKITGLFF